MRGRFRLFGWFSLLAAPLCAETLALPQASTEAFQQASNRVAQLLQQPRYLGPARNIILFIGDGHGVSSVTASRIYAGQLAGLPGEEFVQSFEAFPHLALAKTYSTDSQTPDSAATATALLTGVKTRMGMVSVSPDIALGDCLAAQTAPLATVLELAEQAGMATGIVTTTRLTHATPAAAYAHSAFRGFEDDTDLKAQQLEAGCRDIARQYVEFAFGDGIDVTFAGGRRHFLPVSVIDEEGDGGRRRDKRNLITEWQQRHPGGHFLWNQAQFDALDAANTDKILGLFNSSHMRYEADRARDEAGEPSLAQMTEKALQRLEAEPQGYFLQVEAGRIDHAHHKNNAARALLEGKALADAVSVAVARSRPEETLIIVTADHSHPLVLQGYARRGHPILGLSVRGDKGSNPDNSPQPAADGLPYTTLGYLNGPGAQSRARADLSNTDTQAVDFVQQALLPAPSSTHAGEDVAVYAWGARAYLVDGTLEQNLVFHIMAAAADLYARAGKAAGVVQEIKQKAPQSGALQGE